MTGTGSPARKERRTRGGRTGFAGACTRIFSAAIPTRSGHDMGKDREMRKDERVRVLLNARGEKPESSASRIEKVQATDANRRHRVEGRLHQQSEHVGQAKADSIVDAQGVHQPEACPVCTPTYKIAIAALSALTGSCGNFQTAGRGGLHRCEIRGATAPSGACATRGNPRGKKRGPDRQCRIATTRRNPA